MNKLNYWTDKLLKSRQFLFLLSLVFALLLFFNVNQNLNFVVLENTTDYIMNDVKLDVELNVENQIVEGNPSTVGFRINGKKADVERFKNERNIKAKIDVKEHYGENIGIPIVYSTTKDYNVVISPLVKEVSVNVYKKITVEKDIQIIVDPTSSEYKLKGLPVVLSDSGNIIKKLQITGSEKQLQKITTVEFKVVPQQSIGQKIEKIEPHFLDQAGNTIPIESQKYAVQYVVEAA